jgi:hypothetical protein
MTLEWKWYAPEWYALTIGDFMLMAGESGHWEIMMNGEHTGVSGRVGNLISAKFQAVSALRSRAIAVLEALGQWSP